MNHIHANTLRFLIESLNNNHWIVRVKSHDHQRYAKIELIVDYQQESVVGSLLRYRGFHREEISSLMDSIIDGF